MASRTERPPSAMMWYEDESAAEGAGGRRGRRTTPPLPALNESYRDVDSDLQTDECYSSVYRYTREQPGDVDIETGSEAAFISVDDGDATTAGVTTRAYIVDETSYNGRHAGRKCDGDDSGRGAYNADAPDSRNDGYRDRSRRSSRRVNNGLRVIPYFRRDAGRVDIEAATSAHFDSTADRYYAQWYDRRDVTDGSDCNGRYGRTPKRRQPTDSKSVMPDFADRRDDKGDCRLTDDGLRQAT